MASRVTKQETSERERSILTLESGPSLAEEVYTDEKAPTGEKALNTSVSTGTSSSFEESIDSLRSSIASDIIGSHCPLEMFTSPFEVPPSLKGSISDRCLKVPLVYCDQTASNRPVNSIEHYMEENCLPLYGNTHTNTSITGSQSTAFVAEARQIVAEATNAKISGKAALDVVLFAGNGATSSVELLIDCLGLKHTVAESNDKNSAPVIFVGPYEHHSNLLPWRECGCEIVMVPECPMKQTIDLSTLENLLQSQQYADRIKIGTFTAASNVTGKVSDVDAIAATLHRHGALAFFDYATGAPYLDINMNPTPSSTYPSASLVAKDAVFISPHKMLGGVGTPGVLIIKKHLVQQVNPPNRAGGGTVFYVTNTHHRFLSNRIERYEGGTPNISGIIRTGLTFLLKRKVEDRFALLRDRSYDDDLENKVESMIDYEYRTHQHAVQTLRDTAPNLILLDSGNSSKDPHLPIFSFLIKCGRRFLHFNYVCAILNDLFGIQSRGGCQCSGPYSQRLLGLSTLSVHGKEVPNNLNEQIEHALVHHKERAELLRPGYTRLSLPFKGIRKEENEYVLKALAWVSQHGWKLMCQYRCNHRTGEWRHFSRQGKPLGRERRWLSHYNMFGSPEGKRCESKMECGNEVKSVLDKALANADEVLAAVMKDQTNISQALKMNDASSVLGGDELDNLRWYVYPKECAKWLSECRSFIPESKSNIVLGAVRPINFCDCDQPTNTPGAGASESTVGIVATPGRKRKKPEESKALKITSDSQPTTGSNTEQDKVITKPPSKTQDFFFREGDHEGESSFEDIEAGFEDGELSEQCEIFDEESDSWIPIIDFLEKQKKFNKGIERMSGEQGDSAVIKNEGCSEVLMELSENIQEEIAPALTNNRNIDTPAGVTNERKKPSRDSSTWGRGSLVKLQTNPVITDEVNSNEKQAQQSTIGTTEEPLQNDNKPKKKKRGVGIKPPPKMMRYITQAIVQWNMIEEGDTLLLGLSGGKDSLSLLHCLLEMQRRLPTKFSIEVCTIDPMTPSFDPSPLIPYVEALGLKYHYIKDDIVSRASSSGRDGKEVSSLCAFCARMKRGNLYTCARKNNCNKLVLAQHLDDCAESFMMSIMHNGFLRTMKANYRINAGDISVIRPMVYCRESLMTDFAKSANLPVINENCPACFEEPKERARVKKLFSREETLYPNLYDNIRRALIPLMHDDSTSIMRCYTEEAVSKSRKNQKNNPSKKHAGKVKVRTETGTEVKVDAKEPSPALTKEKKSPAEREDDKLAEKYLHEASEEELLRELVKRKASKFRFAGASARLENDAVDPTGQVCTLNGGNGSIPCRELME